MNAKIAKHKNKYGYEDVAADFRQKIRSGVLKPGQKMPSVAQLKIQFGLPQPAIMRAQDLLENEGLIFRRQGSGTFVSESSEWLRKGRRSEVSTITKSSLMVLTSYRDALNPNHRAPGWAIHTTLGIIQQCHQHNLHAMLLKTSHITMDDLDQVIQSLPFGIVISEQHKSDINFLDNLCSKLSAARVPVVSLSDIHSEIDCVVSDQAAGAYKLTNWLIDTGKSRILFLLPLSDRLGWTARRRTGYEQAIAEHSLRSRIVFVPDGPRVMPDSEDEFDLEARRLLGHIAEHLVGEEACDAIMVPSDGSVFGVARACRLLGKIPNQDFMIVGYDNYWQEAIESQWEPVRPAATIDKDNQKIGQEMVSLLIDRVEGRLPEERQIRSVEPVLVVVD